MNHNLVNMESARSQPDPETEGAAGDCVGSRRLRAGHLARCDCESVKNKNGQPAPTELAIRNERLVCLL
jgi:hypothetical protein